LPVGYDPTKQYAVTFAAGGCGSDAMTFARSPPPSLVVDTKRTHIEVSLSYIMGCFPDGGPVIGNRGDSPDVPYFRAVLADVESHFCVDRSRVFVVSGLGSGAWEAELLGCAAADVVRGITAFGGGLRVHRPACNGPMAAMLFANTNDTNNPLGPVAMDDPFFIRMGSTGFLPERDELLQRNGCVGSATAPWDATYPACVQFTGCPAAYPVVFCTLGGVSQNPYYYNGVQYVPGGMWSFLSALP
jgi:hypothetical protein